MPSLSSSVDAQDRPLAAVASCRMPAAFTLERFGDLKMETRLPADELELRATQIVGQMLFAFSRLDVSLGLYIVWSNNGKDLEDLTNRFNESSTHAKLAFIEKLFMSKYAEATQARVVFDQWSSEMHAMRNWRNDLVHGRWGIVESSQEVANVVGLPTSPNQREERFSLQVLSEAVSTVIALERRLNKIRKAWPL